MSKKSIIVLIYHIHKLLDSVNRLDHIDLLKVTKVTAEIWEDNINISIKNVS
jgi:hypothetical protein